MEHHLASALLSTAGLPRYVKAHRAAGGASASVLMAIGLSIIPVFCLFVGFYQFFSNPPRE